jgi:hypothetical protein
VHSFFYTFFAEICKECIEERMHLLSDEKSDKQGAEVCGLAM